MSEQNPVWVRVRDFDDLEQQHKGDWRQTVFAGVSFSLMSDAAFFVVESVQDISTQGGVIEGPFVRLEAALAAFDAFVSELDVRAETKVEFPALRAQIENLPDYSAPIAASGAPVISAEGIENAMLREWIDISAYRKVLEAEITEGNDKLLAEIFAETGIVLGGKIICGEVPVVMGFNQAAHKNALLVPKTAVLEALDEVARPFAGSFQVPLLVGFAQIAVIEAQDCADGVPQPQRDAWVAARKKSPVLS